MNERRDEIEQCIKNLTEIVTELKFDQLDREYLFQAETAIHVLVNTKDENLQRIIRRTREVGRIITSFKYDETNIENILSTVVASNDPEIEKFVQKLYIAFKNHRCIGPITTKVMGIIYKREFKKLQDILENPSPSPSPPIPIKNMMQFVNPNFHIEKIDFQGINNMENPIINNKMENQIINPVTTNNNPTIGNNSNVTFSNTTNNNPAIKVNNNAKTKERIHYTAVPLPPDSPEQDTVDPTDLT